MDYDKLKDYSINKIVIKEVKKSSVCVCSDGAEFPNRVMMLDNKPVHGFEIAVEHEMVINAKKFK